jgi:hypothetical protein
MIFSRTPGKTENADDFSADPRLRALREQFPRVDPRSLCLPGGMTRSELVKFLTVLAGDHPARPRAAKTGHCRGRQVRGMIEAVPGIVRRWHPGPVGQR